MAAEAKDTIYIDIDDEITGIIDKLQVSKGKIVALVLPKRAAVFQSIVNMKLLKRAADSADKHLVLITSEAGLLPLAGAAGVHVAKTLTSKPEIPLGPQLPEENDDAVPEDTLANEEPPLDAEKPVGDLAGAAPAAADGVETLVLDDEEPAPEEAAAATPKKPKNKKLSIPNFERFRLWLILGGLVLVLLIIGMILAASALPKATISIKTDASTVNTNVSLNLSPAAKTLDPTTGTIPAKLAQEQRTYTQQAATTGQKNNGNKASGSISMSGRECAPNLGTPATVPAGTGVSSNGQTYITQQNTSFSDSGHGSGSCITYQATGPTTIIAQNPGSSYNGATSFTVAGRSDVSASVASAIAGGTDSIVRTVNQNDINSAKAKIALNDDQLKQTLNDDLTKANYFAILSTYSSGTPVVSSSAPVGDVADNVTVTETVTYTMFGVPQSDLKTLVENNIKSQIDTAKQSILDNGIAKAVFNVDNISPTAAQITMSGTATVGPDLNVADIRTAAAGKKPGAVKSDLGSNPDVVSVDVKLSPFWVSSVPKKTSRITVHIAKPVATKPSTANGTQ